MNNSANTGIYFGLILASGSSQNNTDPFSNVPFLISCHNRAILRKPSATKLNSNFACVPGFK